MEAQMRLEDFLIRYKTDCPGYGRVGILAYGALMDNLEFSELQVHISTETINGKSVEMVKFAGKVTNSNSYDLNRKIYKIFESNNYNVILDLTDLEYINSTGVAILFSIFYRVKEHDGKIVIGGVHPFLQRVFGLMELPAGLETFEALDDAKAAF